MIQARKLKRVRLDELEPWEGNPREISEENLDRLKAGIEHFGLVQPIVVNRKTGRIVGGHQRLKVLEAAGETHTYVIEVELDEPEEIALNVALNNPALTGSWDQAKLARILTDLEDGGTIERSGFAARDLGDLLSELEKTGDAVDRDVTVSERASVGFSVALEDRGFIESTLEKAPASKRGDALLAICRHFAESVEGIDFDPGQKRRKLKRLDRDAIEIREVNFALARRLVETYHYTHRWPPSATFAIGGFYRARLLGIVVYGTGASPYLVTAAFDGLDRKEGWELVRLFAFDWAPKNVESYLIGRSFRYLEAKRPDIRVVLSFADPGQGHLGTIYQATNWLYTGTTAGQYYLRTEDGLVHSRTYNELPLSERHELLDKEENLVWQEGRHRYVYLLGSKKSKRELRKALKYDVLPYPKEDP